MEDDLHEVHGTPDQISDLWGKVDELDSTELGRYALGLGLTRSQEPPGYPWEVVVSHPDIFTDLDYKVLAWLGPDSNAPDESELWEEPGRS